MKGKIKDKTPALKRQIKSLQEQVSAQDDMMHSMAVQISEIMRELQKQKEDTKETGMRDIDTSNVDMNKLCHIVARIEDDVRDLKEHHVTCKNLSKTVDELGALCASAMVAAGTKLHHEITERQSSSHSYTSRGGKINRRHMTSAGPGLINGILPSSNMYQSANSVRDVHTDERSHASVVSQRGAAAASASAVTDSTAKDISTDGEPVPREEDNDGFTVVARKQKKFKKQNVKAKSGAVLVGGSNVRRIAIAARNEFDMDGAVFKCKPGMLIEEAHQEVRTAVREAESSEVDVVLHVGSADLAKHRSVDYILEGLAGVIESSYNTRHVREVVVCSVEERNDMGRDVYESSCHLNEQLLGLCHSYGARFLDLRTRLRECRFGGINRTGLLYTSEGSHNISQLILSEVYGFLD